MQKVLLATLVAAAIGISLWAFLYARGISSLTPWDYLEFTEGMRTRLGKHFPGFDYRTKYEDGIILVFVENISEDILTEIKVTAKSKCGGRGVYIVTAYKLTDVPIVEQARVRVQ